MKFEKRKQRFSIRKFSFGAASVFLGTVIFATAVPVTQVSADEQVNSVGEALVPSPSSTSSGTAETIPSSLGAESESGNNLLTVGGEQTAEESVEVPEVIVDANAPAIVEANPNLSDVTPVEESSAGASEATQDTPQQTQSVSSTPEVTELSVNGEVAQKSTASEVTTDANLVDVTNESKSSVLETTSLDLETASFSSQGFDATMLRSSLDTSLLRATPNASTTLYEADGSIVAPTKVAKDADAPYNTLQILANMPQSSNVTVIGQGDGVNRTQEVGTDVSSENRIWGGNFNSQLDPSIARAAPNHGAVTIQFKGSNPNTSNYAYDPKAGWNSADLDVDTSTMWVKVRYTDAAYFDGQLVDAIATITVTPYKNRTQGASWANANYGNVVYYPTIQISDVLYGGFVWQNVNDFHINLQFVPKGGDESQAITLSTGNGWDDSTVTYYTVNSLDPASETYKPYGGNENPGAVYGPESALPEDGTVSGAYVVEGTNIVTSYDGGPSGIQYAYNGGTTPWGTANSNSDQDKPGHPDWSNNSVLFIVAPGADRISVRLGNLERSLEQQEVPRTNYIWATISTASFIPNNAQGKVVVQYVNTKGETIKTEVVDMPEQNILDSQGKLVEYNTLVDHKPGTISATESLDGKDYKFKKVSADSAPEVGVLRKGTTTVIYVYERTTGDVNAQYVIKDTNTQLSGTTVEADGSAGTTSGTRVVKADAPVGDDYTATAPTRITTADGTIYKLLGVRQNEGDAQATGQVTADTQTVTYEYTKVEVAETTTENKGTVIVHYKDTEGNTIAADETDTDKVVVSTTVTKTEDGEVVSTVTTPTNAQYDTTDHKHPSIETSEGKVYKLVEDKTEGTESGTLPAGTTEVTYVYELVKGDVVVKYEDKDGNPISGEETGGNTSVKDEDQADTGTDYDTTDKRPDKITTPDGKVYNYTEVKDGSDPETGKVTEDPKTVTYVYELAKGDVVVNYVDESGNPISGAETGGNTSVKDVDQADTGTDYDTTDKRPGVITTADGTKYTYVKVQEGSDPETGKVTEGTKTVTYVYRKVEVGETTTTTTGTVIVHYKDTEGNTIAADETDTDKVVVSTTVTKTEDGEVVSTVTTPSGATYDTTDHKHPSIETSEGKVYKLVEDKTEGTESGTLPAGTTEVTYVYELVKGDVVVKYEDKDGNPISGEETGGNTSVKDEDQADTGTDYDTTDKRPGVITTADGTKYTYVKVQEGSDPETGKVTEETKTVTYVYRKVEVAETTTENKGTVIVHYKDTEGNTIAADETDTDAALVSTTVTKTEDGEVVSTVTTPTNAQYDTTDHKHPSIETTEGKVYKLVEDKTEGTESGTLPAGTTEVTYVYELVKGDVVVKYEDKDGNPISGEETGGNTSVKDVDQADTGTDYDTTDKRPGVITTADGTKYTYVKVQEGSDPETGKVTEETKTVTYVYRKVEVGETTTTTTGTVIVHYKDTEGNTIAADETDTDKVVVSTTVTKTEDGEVVSTVTTPSGATYDTTDHKPGKIEKEGSTYVLVPSKTVGVETGEVVEGTTEVTYVYQKVANWIPDLPGVPEEDRPNTPYPFDPEQPDNEIPAIPTNPETDQPVVPHVPGYTPVDPKDNTPLTPVDPEDPSKGYIPPVPGDPGVDTHIPYVPNPEPPVVKEGSVVVHYQDTEGNKLQESVTDTNKASVGTAYDTSDHKPGKIEKEGSTYVLVPSKTVGVETGEVVEGTTEVTYVYQKVANWIPDLPGVPEEDRPNTPYPFDPEQPDNEIPAIPTNPETDQPVVPHVPGYTPVDPKDNTPLTPVDPEDPSKGYIPPVPGDPGVDTHIPYVPNPEPPVVKEGSVVVHYQDTEGNKLQESVTDTNKASVGTAYDTSDHKPGKIEKEGSTYVLVPSKTVGVETGEVVEGTTEVTYVYQKVANWIPDLPGVPEEDRPNTPYPFDPEQPDNEIPAIPTNPETDQPVVPHVPGYTPVDPKDNTPLTPVDPEDPSKGYIPPVPGDPGVDTHIPYVPNPEPTPKPTPTPTPTPDSSQPEKVDTHIPYVPNPEPTPKPTPTPTPTPDSSQPEKLVKSVVQTTLPKTGDSDTTSAVAGGGLLLAMLGLVGIKRRRKED